MKNRNFSEWFNEILEKAGILDIRYPVKGLYVWLPYGMKLRENVIKIIKEILEKRGHEEVLFPLLIPENYLRKESEHIRGFEEQVYWVTKGGSKELSVKLALRPTSETAIYPMVSLWIRSHKDLPLKIYQIVNVFRYETKHTRPLIRLREITTFKEAHTFHSNPEEAEEQVKEAINIYKEFFDRLAIPYVINERPDWDKFPGAVYTIAFDTLFPDGRSLQIATIHNLGQNFSKPFNIKYEKVDGSYEYVYQTCYGISDRVIATVIAIHGDDNGLILLPEISPYQIVIIPIIYKEIKEEVLRKANELYKILNEYFRVYIDLREDETPGSKYYYWEMKGVPIRIEIGPKDLKENVVTIFRRDERKRVRIKEEELIEYIKRLFNDIYKNLREKAWKNFRERILEARDINELKEGYMYEIFLCGKDSCGKYIEEKTGLRVLGRAVDKKGDGYCIVCKEKNSEIYRVAKSY